MKNVAPGLPLFLFNYSDRMLHGIYEAASAGELNINPYGWTVKGEHRTKYPAQVNECYFYPFMFDISCLKNPEH